MNRKKFIYLKLKPHDRKISSSGIDFSDFIRNLPNPCQNILLIKGNCFGSRCRHNFELFEGSNEIQLLANSDDIRIGDLCLVDYDKPSSADDLSDEEIAELLYAGHMFKPIHSPFFASLRNHFLLLSHDNGWDCNLYYDSPRQFIDVIFGIFREILNITVIASPDDALQDVFFDVMEKGILLRPEKCKNNCVASEIGIYVIGDCNDFDKLSEIESGLSHSDSFTRYCVSISNDNWTITRQHYHAD